MDNQASKYEEIGKNYRFFLSWRYGIFGAQLFVLWNSLSLCYKLILNKTDFQVIGFLLIIASIVSLCLWIAEKRNRELYQELIIKGKPKEDSANEAYTILAEISPAYNKKWKLFTQSTALDILAYVCFIVLIDCGIVIFNEPNLLDFNICNISSCSKCLILIIDILFFGIIDPLGLKYIFKQNK